MPRPQLIICESSSRWAVALRWLMADAATTLRETREWEDCLRALRDAPASLVLMEASAGDIETAVARLLDIRHNFPQARAVALGERTLAVAEPLLREAGAVHVVLSPRDLAAVIKLAQRHLAAASQPPADVRQAVWERLPWEAASST